MSETHRIEIKHEVEPDKEQSKTVKLKPKFNYIVRLATLAIILLLAVVVWWVITGKNSSPIPKNIQKNVRFPIYYPSHLPAGYSLDKNSTAYENNILFFTISNGSRKISVSEQAAPQSPPDFSSLQKFNTSFKKLDLIGGEAIYGVSQGLPVAILTSNTTLVNISGSTNVPLDVIAKTTQTMSSNL